MSTSLYSFSHRLSWIVAPNEFSSLLSEAKASGKAMLDLSVSNPTEALAKYPHLEIADALGAIDDFRYQPEAFGRPATRTVIVRRMLQRFPLLDLSPEHVALTASTSEAYAILFKLLANPGDEVLVPAPSYPLFDYLARLEGVKLRPYLLRYDGSWFIDFESLQAVLSPRTRAVILVNPNNPTGTFLKNSEFVRLRDFAMAHALPLISDEVFMDYAFAESADRMTTLTGQHDLLSFTLNGLSKGAGMPQMKLGWLVVNGPPLLRQQACERLELIMDTYLSVSAPVQLAAERLLAIGDNIQRRIQDRIQDNLASLGSLLHNQPVHMLGSEGGWSAILRVPQMLSEEEWIRRLLRDHQVIVQPGYFFDMTSEAFLVVSLLTPPDILSAGIKKIVALAHEI